MLCCQNGYATNLGISKVLQCPHCGGLKPVMNIISVSPYVYTEVWSDLYNPISLSKVQKCPICGEYSFVSQMKEAGYDMDAESYSGRLPYSCLKEAAAKLLPTNDKADELGLRMELLWAYNNLYMTENSETPTDEDIEYMRQNIELLIRLLSDNKQSYIFRAELLREMGHFDECIRLLKRNGLFTSSGNRFIRRLIRRYAQQNDARIIGWILNPNKRLPEEYDYGEWIRCYGQDCKFNPRHPIRVFDELPIKENTAEPNKNHTSTLNIPLQYYGEELMDANIGAVVAIQPRTGDILMMVSSPSYDADRLASPEDGNYYMELLNDERHPLINRTIKARYQLPDTIISMMLPSPQDSVIIRAINGHKVDNNDDFETIDKIVAYRDASLYCTPMALAQFAALLANGGICKTPRLKVSEIEYSTDDIKIDLPAETSSSGLMVSVNPKGHSIAIGWDENIAIAVVVESVADVATIVKQIETFYSKTSYSIQ